MSENKNVLSFIEQTPSWFGQRRAFNIDGTTMTLGSRERVLCIRMDLDLMRPWSLTADDVLKAMFSSYMIGQPFQKMSQNPQTVEYVYTHTSSRENPKSFENILLRATPDGKVLRLKDIAKVEIAAVYPSYYNNNPDLDGQPSRTIVLEELPGTNATVVFEQIMRKLGEMKESLPPGLTVEISDEFPTSWNVQHNPARPAK